MGAVDTPWTLDSTSPGHQFFAITPSDTDALPHITRGIYVGVGGDIAIEDPGETAVVFKNAIAGTIIPVMTRQVNSTNTTATNLVGVY